MASKWAKSLPVVTVEQGRTPKRVTIVLPFYQNQEFFLNRQVRSWSLAAVRDLRPFVSVIVVDDGSPEPAYLPSFHPVAMRLFRINVDVRWNWLAARNIGAHAADDGWILFTDMDHVVPPQTMRSIVYGQHDPKVIYAFSRREHTGDPVTPHSASFLMTRKVFWQIGGYDETLSGHYGTDGDFRRRAVRVAPIHVLTDELTRYEYVADSSTTRYLRKQPEDARVRELVNKRKPGWHPKVLSFPYQEVSA